MYKKKFSIILSAIFVPVAITVTAALVAPQLMSTFSESSETWVHYDAKAATVDRRGCKEYWVSCTSHNHVFEAPQGVAPEAIVSGGVLADNILYSLAENDDRVIAPTLEALTLDFETASDADYVFSLRNNFSKKEIVADGVTGNCLELQWKDGTGDFALTDAYLDACFADPAVTGIAFDVKSSVNFDIQRYDGAKQVRYMGNGHNMYQSRTTHFKTYVWDRTVYNTWKTVKTNRSNAFLWVAVTANSTSFYLDNIRPVTYDDVNTNIGDFEGTPIHDDNVANLSCRLFENSANAEQFIVLGASSYTLSGDYYSSGKKSLKVSYVADKNAQILLNNNFRNKVGANDILAFDVLLKAVDPADFAGYNSASIKVGGSAIDKGGFLVNEWHTIQVTKAQMTASAYIFECPIGSRSVDFYFDNLRIIHSSHTQFGFETEGVLTKTVNTEYRFNQAWNTTSNAYADLKVLSTDNKAVAELKTSRSLYTEGKQSLMLIKKSGYIAFFISSELKTALADQTKKLSFDLYTTMDLVTADSSGQIMNGMNKAMPHTHTSGTWNTYVLNVSDMTADGRFLIITGSGTGEVFFDNFQMVD